MFKNHSLACNFKIDGYETNNSSKGEVLFSEEHRSREPLLSYDRWVTMAMEDHLSVTCSPTFRMTMKIMIFVIYI